jgi:histidyl-tRNA synthetase
MGFDRIVLVLKESGKYNVEVNDLDVFFSCMTDAAYPKMFAIIQNLRDNNISCDYDICKRSFKAGLKYANKQNAKFVAIIGEDELNKNVCSIKNMQTSSQEEVNLDTDSIMEYISNK